MQFIKHKPLNQKWLKAAIIGSLWASVEIIVGSFLHNLKIPLSGTVLSFISVFLMVSFLQLWKEKGLIWRAGLICALMKSISPSAIIFGPMIGIFSEALLLELTIFLFGTNLFSYSLGGALAVFSAFVHKVVMLLIMYGFDLVKILESLYKFSVKQINLPNLNPITLILLICVFYALTGISAAILGYLTGRKNSRLQSSAIDHTIRFESKNQLIYETKAQKYSVILLVFNLLSIIFILVLLNLKWGWFSITLSVSYVIFCLSYYKRSLKRIQKPSLWIQFILITLIAAMFWNGFSTGQLLDPIGLLTGVKMVIRAMIVLVGFSAISVELRNPLIKTVLYRNGFDNLYQSLGLAFGALPDIIGSLPKPAEWLKHPLKSYLVLYQQSNSLLITFTNEHQNRPSVFIITGKKQQGKTKFTREVISLLKDRNIEIGGFFADGVHEDGKRIGFDLVDSETGTNYLLCRTSPNKNFVTIGPYYFDPAAIDKGNELLLIAASHGAKVVVIDEIGPLELKNKGWASSIDFLCTQPQLIQVWVVRKKLVRQFTRRWNVRDICIADIMTDNPKRLSDEIVNKISSTK